MNLMDLVVDSYKDIKAQKYLGIFGHPIGHTLSPVIHDTISDALGKDMRYIPFHVENDLGTAVKAAFAQGIVGLNITVPHKQAVMEYLVDIDDAAKAIGAVNTLVRTEQGFKGYNTDMPGLARAIASEGIELNGKNVIMLGAGGAARAVAYMCLKYGASKLYIVNRTYEKAKQLADDMNQIFDVDIAKPVAAADYNMIELDEYIMIQCTSVGLHEDDGLPLITDEEFYKMASCGVDLIYNPAQTPFIKTLLKLGIKAFNGLKMLLYQGVMAYELWNDVEVSDSLVETVYRNLCEAIYGKKIVLVGYMGAGKTTIGKKIANDYGYEFLDTDEMIVQEAGMSISDIFAKYGEAHFREIESEILQKILNHKGNLVVSTGGGLPLKENNRNLIKIIGKVFYLHASADNIYDRVKGDTARPLLMCDDPYKKICQMLEERDPIYRLAMDVLIDTSSQDLDKIVNNIMSFMI